MRKNLFFLPILLLFPFSVFAENSGTLTSTQNSTVVSLIETIASLRDQMSDNESRIATLEQENKTLKNILSSQGIIVQVTSSGVTSFTGGVISVPSSVVSTQSTENLSAIATSYSPKFAGMIERMNREWQAVRENYQFPVGAVIGEYEFVNTGALDRVFVDVIFTGGVLSGSYDAKLLYRFDQETYERTLLGLFIFDPGSRRYITARGSNPYSETARTRIRSPYLGGTVITTPVAPTTVSSGTTTVVSDTSTGSVTDSGASAPVSLTAINKAYSEKRYLSVISLSDQYLTENAPTVEILTMRYRAYFIIRKFPESLAEIAKIATLVSPLPKTIACDGSVIADYAGNTDLKESYKAICNG